MGLTFYTCVLNNSSPFSPFVLCFHRWVTWNFEACFLSSLGNMGIKGSQPSLNHHKLGRQKWAFWGQTNGSEGRLFLLCIHGLWTCYHTGISHQVVMLYTVVQDFFSVVYKQACSLEKTCCVNFSYVRFFIEAAILRERAMQATSSLPSSLIRASSWGKVTF